MEIRVLTQNLRGPSDPPPHDWASRRPRFRALLDRVQPDFIATQEAHFAMLQDLRRDAPPDAPLEWTGLGRRGGSSDEHCAVVHRADRWEVTAYDHLALSATPRTIPSTWTAAQDCPRMVTWARYRHRVSGTEVTIASTHLDQLCATSRSASAQQLAELAAALGDGPVVLAGDFNDEPGSPAYRTLTGALTPIFPTTEARDTFNGYGAGGGCIDWILQRGFDAAAWHVLTPTPPVSDHNGVLAQLILDKPATAAR